MNGEQASQLAELLQAEMPVHTTVNVNPSGSAHVVVETGKCTFVVRGDQSTTVSSVMYGELGRYITDSDNPPHRREYHSAEELIAELGGFVANAEYFTATLRQRQVAKRGDYTNRAAICKDLLDANSKLRLVHAGTEVDGGGKTWYATIEVISAEQVSFYIRCDSDTAIRVARELGVK